MNYAQIMSPVYPLSLKVRVMSPSSCGSAAHALHVGRLRILARDADEFVSGNRRRIAVCTSVCLSVCLGRACIVIIRALALI